MDRKQDQLPLKKKDKYRVRNWREYNQSLVNRGNITFWFSEEIVQKWYSHERTGKRGRPEFYSDDAIRCALMIRAVFRVALRGLQGLVTSLLKIMGLDLVCPHYSLFSLRAGNLRIPMERLLKPGARLNVIFDSTGVKVFGEGEWKVRQHGYSKRRTWRKVHIGMCTETGQIVVGAVTSNNVSDDEVMVHMVGAMNGVSLGDVHGDGAYDTVDCRFAIHSRGGKSIIPPDKNAKLQKSKGRIPALEERDLAIKRIQELGDEGRTRWKEEVGYHKRSRIETCMYRYKSIGGEKLRARKKSTQVTEVLINLAVLNRMTQLGRPKSYRVAV